MKKSLVALAALSAMGHSAAAGWSRTRCDEPFGHEHRALNAGGLLANIDSATLNKNDYMQAFGDCISLDGKVALAANPSAADVIRIMRIPAGTKVQAVMLANDDLDSNGAPTIVFSLGYVPAVAGDGPNASPAYFAAAGNTQLQSQGKGTWYGNFDPITFDKDVYLTVTIGTPSATFAAGAIWAVVEGVARGVR